MHQKRAAAALFTLSLFQAHSQPPVAQPAFEVASIRLNRTEMRGGSMEFSRGGERFTMRNMPLGALILVAYNITVRQLSGNGEFLSRRYDITARAEHPVRKEEMLRMLQALLADRFKLIVRRETREVPVYALTVGKSGPKLEPSELPDSETPRTPAEAGGTEPKPGHLIFENESMPDLAWALSRTGAIDRPVVDATGLKGRYDFELKFGRDTAPQAAVPPAEAGINVELPSIFAALPEQLGLRLESRKAPIEFLVIEHIEKPSEN